MADEKTAKIEDNLQSKETWRRLFFMLVLAACFGIAEFVTGAVILFQFAYVLITGEHNANLLRLGASLSRYLFDLSRYLTYSSEFRPFPFGPWPAEEAEAAFSAQADEE